MKHFISTLLLSAFVAQLSAQEFIVNAFSVSDARTSYTGFEPINLIDGSELGDATIVETGDPVPGVFPTHNNGFGAGMWRVDTTPPDSQLVVTFDLANDTTTYDLTAVYIWNYNENFFGTPQSDRGVQDVTIEWSDDFQSSWNPVGNFTFAQAPALNTYTGERIDFASTLSGATDIRFTPTSNYGDGSFTGLSEVRFIAAAIPEPSTFALVVLSFAALIGFRRRMK